MNKLVYFILFSLVPLVVWSQQTISGVVTDTQNEPLIGANIYLQDTYDGATSAADGSFRFETFETGNQILIVSFIGFETQKLEIDLSAMVQVSVKLKDAFNTMQAVTISAGSMEASDEKKAVVLKSLDVAMTAGATADIAAAMTTLPGTQRNSESGRLFVRGGTANETKVFVDGMEAANFYGSTGSAIPSRSRFSPFLFKGTFFSTGGYSAEYGQAMSSALILSTKDVAAGTEWNVSLTSVGIDASTTQHWKKQSLYATVGYNDLNPYNQLVRQRIDWQQGSRGLNSTLAYKRDYADGSQLRSMVMGSTGSFSLHQLTKLNAQGYNAVSVANDFLFATASYEKPVGEGDTWYTGVSYTRNQDDMTYDAQTSVSPRNYYHIKSRYFHEFGPKTGLKTGGELYYRTYSESLQQTDGKLQLDFEQVRPVAFAEVDHYLSESWVIRAGIRSEYENYQDTWAINPRFSVAHQLTDNSQLSVATGVFSQDADEEFLRFSSSLQQERASHLILNYQYIANDRVLRVESYYKGYDHLVKYTNAWDAATYTNNGDGYAYGLDVFWRDRKTFKGFDYWVSYSWLQSERDFRNYPTRSVPGFATTHNLSLVGKKWINSIRSQIGMTYSIASGRPYDNPMKDGFNESRTPLFHDLSFNMAWLPTPRIIVYTSASNLLGADQIFGYRYADAPNAQGFIASEAVRMPAKRFLFLGVFYTLSGKNNNLETL